MLVDDSKRFLIIVQAESLSTGAQVRFALERDARAFIDLLTVQAEWRLLRQVRDSEAEGLLRKLGDREVLGPYEILESSLGWDALIERKVTATNDRIVKA